MARGRDDFADAYVDEKIGISAYPLSASVACGKVLSLSFLYSLLPRLRRYLSLLLSVSMNNRLLILPILESSSAARWKISGTLFNL